jgi:hypothetical protein
VNDRQAFLQARCGSVGASDVPDLVRRTKSGYSATRANLMALKVIERLTGVPVETYQSKAMADGLAKEPLAREAYGILHDVVVEQTDPIRHPLIKGAHASPDGLIGALGLVEIKCPEKAAHLETLLIGKVERDYFIQIQWQLACTGRHWADYVSWNPDFPRSMQFWEQRVERDPALMSELEGEVVKFLAELENKLTELDVLYPEAA